MSPSRTSKSAFDSCTSLKKVTLPPSLEHLECAVFMNCPNLETISGEALSGYRILDGALYDETGTVLLAFPCARTGRYAIPEETRELAYGSLSHSRLSEVILPEGLERIGN